MLRIGRIFLCFFSPKFTLFSKMFHDKMIAYMTNAAGEWHQYVSLNIGSTYLLQDGLDEV